MVDPRDLLLSYCNDFVLQITPGEMDHSRGLQGLASGGLWDRRSTAFADGGSDGRYSGTGKRPFADVLSI